MAINNVSNWLSFLNERITSYETSQNSYVTLLEVIFALAVAMIGVMATTYKVVSLFMLIGQAIFIFATLVVGGLVISTYTKQRNSPNSPYPKALLIRTEILKGNLTDPNDICQLCIDAHILL